MEDNKNVNLPPIGLTPSEDKRKKPLFAALLSRAGGRGGWGSVLASLTASKTAMVAVALGITALGGLATMFVRSGGVANGGGSGEALAFKPYENYNPSAQNFGDDPFPLPYAEGERPYLNEVYKASVMPDLSEGEAAAEQTAAAAAAAAEQAVNGLRSQAPSAANGGMHGLGAGAAASAGKKSGADAQNTALAAAGIAKSAALGSAARPGASVGKTARAARGKFSAGGMGANKPGTEASLATNLEKAKSQSGVVFGEAVSGSGVNVADLPGASDVVPGATGPDVEIPKPEPEYPEPPGGGGGGSGTMTGSSTSTGEDAERKAMAERLKQLVAEANALLQEFLSMANNPEELCPSGGAEKAAAILAKSNEILAQVSAMEELMMFNPPSKADAWRSCVAAQMTTLVGALESPMQEYCDAYKRREEAKAAWMSACPCTCYGYGCDCSPCTNATTEYKNAIDLCEQKRNTFNTEKAKLEQFSGKLSNVDALVGGGSCSM